MDQSFNLPGMYQNRANSLPGNIRRNGMVNARGQNTNIAQPWQADADALPYFSRDQNGQAVTDLIQGYQSNARTLPDRYNSQLSLGRLSGSMMRDVRVIENGLNLRAFGTRGVGVAGRGFRGLGALSTSGQWYENPWYLGAGALAVVGGVYLLTKKKGRR